jgi:hypothetical protein
MIRAWGMQVLTLESLCSVGVADFAVLPPFSSVSLSLLRIRANIYELLTNAIPPDVIMRTLVSVLLRRVDDSIKHEVVQQAAFYDHRMHQGAKPIFHIEAFVAKFMALYRRWLVQTFA